MLLPHLQGRIDFGTVVNQTSLSANHVRTKFAFKKATTDAAEALKESGGAVIIATRHHLHAQLVIDALKAGRDVFVEKPLCLTRVELEAIDCAVEESTGSVMVGFNRRFAPATMELKKVLSGIQGPLVASYRVMAGLLDPKHWYANHAESGGRIVGEVCHFLDYFCALFESAPVQVMTQRLADPANPPNAPDSVALQVDFADGSCGQLIYSAEGDASYPKETLTVFAPGLTADITNFQKLTVYRGRKSNTSRYTSKGHAEEMQAWLDYLQARAPHPLPYAQSRQSMSLTFAAIDSLQQGRSVTV